MWTSLVKNKQESFNGLVFMEGKSGQKEHFLILINDLLILINHLLILINDFLILINHLLILINGMIY